MVTTARRRARALLCCAAAVVAIGAWSTSVAGAAITSINSFDLSPTSGPPGTVVNFSGTACAPGFSDGSDYVEIRAPAFQVVVRAPVTASGSWHGSFTVPANAPTGLPSLVLATCYSDGFVSITTIYSAQTFTVTAPSATTTPTTSTTPTTPTTSPNASGGTTPPTNGDPGPDGGNEPGSTVPVFGGVPPDSSGNTGGGAHNGGSATKPPGAKKVDVSRATHRAARAADLSVPGLPAAQVSSAGGLGWLAWLLVLVLVVSAVGAPFWLRRSRRSQADAIGDGA